MNNVKNSKPKVLVDLRPAFEGYGGIPQEARLLFSALTKLEHFEILGLLNHSGLFLSKGINSKKTYKETKKLNQLSKFIVSTRLGKESLLNKVLKKKLAFYYTCKLLVNSFFPIFKEKLTDFYPEHFSDFIWSLFSKTLSVDEYKNVVKHNYKVLSPPWYFMHRASLKIPWNKSPYLRVDTSDVDILISQELFPFKINKKTKFVVRFHDAIPFFYPHLLSTDIVFHRAKTYYGLKALDKQNAYLVCISNQVKKEVLSIIPRAKERIFVIYNIVSPMFYREIEQLDNVYSVLSNIVISKINKNVMPKFFTIREQINFYEKHTSKLNKYLLIVSSIEPRKNHLRVLSAFERLIKDDDELKIIVVGNLGPDSSRVVERFLPWVEKGKAFFLCNVPLPDLKILYKYAYATVCPSIAEGFDYSGVEAMAVGCPVIASDIAVHKEVYKDGCLYFNPYSTEELINCIRAFENIQIRNNLIEKGKEISKDYKAEKLIENWKNILKIITERG